MSTNISAVIITNNEVDRISKCIQSLLPLTDDIVVVDSGSTDGTIKLAEDLGASVYKKEWMGYGQNKNFGNSKAKNDWIISLDADEYLSFELIREIKSLKLQDHAVYKINRQNYYLGKMINYSGWSPDWVYRLFNRNEVEWNKSLVHEKLILPDNIKVVSLENKLHHHSYRSLEDHKQKIEKYAELRAKIWLDNHNRLPLSKRLFGPFFKGFKSYVLKLGLLDGKEGWTIAKMNSILVRRQIYYFDKLKSVQS